MLILIIYCVVTFLCIGAVLVLWYENELHIGDNNERVVVLVNIGNAFVWPLVLCYEVIDWVKMPYNEKSEQ